MFFNVSPLELTMFTPESQGCKMISANQKVYPDISTWKLRECKKFRLVDKIRQPSNINIQDLKSG